MAEDSLRLAGGAVEVELLPRLGGRLHRLRAFGHDVLRTPATTAAYATDPFFWGSYVMAPWCNRLPTRPTAIGSRTVALPSNYPDGTAIHGQVVGLPWTVDADGSLLVRGGGDGWPWPYEVRQRVTVEGSALRILVTLTNLADDAMPAGMGLHPWLLKPLHVRLAASSVASSNLDPNSVLETVSGPFDLRAMAPLAADLDASWAELADPPLELRWPTFGIGATVRARSTAALSVAIASPEAVDAVAIEPQTHLPGGLRRLQDGDPHGLRLLEPGSALTLDVELEFAEIGSTG
jgi:aldose 1-epimerase